MRWVQERGSACTQSAINIQIVSYVSCALKRCKKITAARKDPEADIHRWRRSATINQPSLDLNIMNHQELSWELTGHHGVEQGRCSMGKMLFSLSESSLARWDRLAGP